MNLYQWRLDSPVGRIYLIASDQGIRGVTWQKQKIALLKSLEGSEAHLRILRQAQKQLGEYFRGTRKKFEFSFDLAGTPFQKKVWHALSKIPYAKTRSYADIAAQIGNPKAVRAVGTANGKNPLCILIPCHRVVRSTGQVGGYAGGVQVKSRLLELELRS